jgi:hypothetical protein
VIKKKKVFTLLIIASKNTLHFCLKKQLAQKTSS